MKFVRLTDVNDPMYSQALNLYKNSFPYHELREDDSQFRIMKNDEYHFCLIYDGDEFIGDIFYWETEDFIYVEHFCISEEKRNKNYGRRALESFGAGKTVILEIDPPEDDISIRRKGFYELCGFRINEFNHVHPPYHNSCKPHALKIMTRPEMIDENMYDKFNSYLSDVVMKDVYSDYA